MTTYGTIETISQRLAILATNNRGKTLWPNTKRNTDATFRRSGTPEREAWHEPGNNGTNKKHIKKTFSLSVDKFIKW